MSIPFQINDDIKSYFKDKDLYEYSNKYSLVKKIENNKGYWYKNSDLISFTGNSLNTYNRIKASPNKWYLISCGSYKSKINLKSNEYTMYMYNEVLGYVKTNVLLPGYGYWFRSLLKNEVTVQINLI